ncbi:RNA polymerase subunit sigma-70 [Streptomyces sp. bgisy100]|uniref:RNA polymerase subunit sigma-70 n=1 Tax=Streptomyces sp. bgisy100 TaxID=3413783 RepID=UPI003D75684E
MTRTSSARTESAADRAEESAVAAAAGAGDETAFAGLAERYRRELRIHCYRMLGSFDDSEDLVQETLLRAWRKRATYAGRAPFRAWLYRIATHACLDFLDRSRRTVPLSGEAAPAAATGGRPLPPVAVPWLQPCPDGLLGPVPADDAAPEAAAVSKETIELAFLAAIQHLPPRQRAVLILRDVLGWPAKDAAALLDTSVAAVNSALQRARPALREQLPERRLEWRAAADPSEEERAVLRRYMDAIERADDAAVAAVLREDVRVGHQAGAGGHFGAEPAWYEGRDTVVAGWAPALHGPDALEFRFLPTRANRQPAAATYVRRPGGSEFRAFALAVLSVEEGGVREVSVFVPDVVPAFGLPRTL